MKRLWIAAAFLLALPLLMWLGKWYTDRATRQMEPLVIAAQRYGDAGDIPAARKELETFAEEWPKKCAVLKTFTRHAELDSLNIEASRMLPYLEKTESGGKPGADYDACCQAVLFQLRNLRVINRMSWANLL